MSAFPSIPPAVAYGFMLVGAITVIATLVPKQVDRLFGFIGRNFPPELPVTSKRKPRRDIYVAEAILFLTMGKWYKRGDFSKDENNADIASWVDATHAIEQAVYDDDLPLWAKDYASLKGDIFKKLEPNVMETHTLVPLHVWRDMDEKWEDLPLTTRESLTDMSNSYVELMTSRAAIRRLARELRRNPVA